MIDLLLAAGDNPLTHVVQHTAVGFGIEGKYLNFLYFPVISNQIIMQVATAALIVWLIPKAVQMRAGGDLVGKLVPRGLGNAIEATCVMWRDAIIRPNLGKYADAFTPFIWSLFFFLLISNLLGMIPLGDWLPFIQTPDGHPLLGGTSTGNIWVTAALAAMVLVLIVYNGLKANGVEYVKHFFMGPFPINLLVGLLEMVGIFFKCMALAIRLFANMVAGHVMLAVLMSFVGKAWAYNPAGGFAIGVVVWLASVALYFLELLVAFLHAFIFTMLTTVFIGMAVNIHHDEHEHEEEHATAAH